MIGLLAVLASSCGSEAQDGQRAPDDPGLVLPEGAERFTGLQPEAGDTLVPPRLGFRWEFRDIGAAPTTTDPEGRESALDDVRFRLQVHDASGAIHADQETRERAVLITLPPSSTPGRYVWWLEAYSATDSSRVAQSGRREFELR